MIKWYKKVVFENYANFKGRARRSEYWYFVLLNIIISLILLGIDSMLGMGMGFRNLYGLAVFIPGLAVSVRRLHDIGKSGWWLLIYYLIFTFSIVGLLIGGLSALIPNSPFGASPNMKIMAISGVVLLISGIWYLIWFFKAGDVGTNEYGADPKGFGEEINEIGAE